MSKTTAGPNPYAQHWANFCEQTKAHALKVVRAEDLDRRLLVSSGGAWYWHWQVVTFPGHLLICGDVADGYLFRREADMLAFFSDEHWHFDDGAPALDLCYWAEKVRGPASRSLRRWSQQTFQASFRAALDDSLDWGAIVLQDIADDLVDCTEDAERAEVLAQLAAVESERDKILEDLEHAGADEETAYEWLAAEPLRAKVVPEPWELDTHDWDVHFLYTCWAIDLTCRLWAEHQAAQPTPDTDDESRG